MKKSLLCALLIAGAMSSCSKSEVLDHAPAENDNLDIVGVDVAITASRGVETTADKIRTSGTTNPLVLSYYATHFDSAASSSTDAAATVGTGTISFLYSDVEGSWSQSANSYGSGSSISGDVTWGHMSIGDTGADGNTPTGYFFSLHNGTQDVALAAPSMLTSSLTATTSDTNGFTQNSWYVNSTNKDTTIDAASQVDLVYYAGEVSAFPSGGNIRGVFHHALSRIEMYSSQGSYVPYVKSVTLVNVAGGGVPKINYEPVSDDVSIDWDSSQVPSVSYICYNGTDANTGKQTGGQEMKDGERLTSTSDYAYSVDNNIMIVPQILDPIAYTGSNNDDIFYPEQNGSITFGDYAFLSATSPHVAVVYRMLDSEGSSVVGYKYAVDCDSFAEAYYGTNATNKEDILKVYSLESDGSSYALGSLDDTTDITVSGGADIANGDYTEKELYELMMDVDTSTALSDLSLLADQVTYDMGITPVSHLYMLVGFPITKSTTLAEGKDYDFKLGIGTTGGILLHPYYVDAFGRSTRIKITDVKVGEYILATSTTAIGLTITVDSWDGGTGDVDM